MFLLKKSVIIASLAMAIGLAATSSTWAQLNNPWALCVADFDGDGSSDLVAANNGGGMISVFFNQGDGAFSDPTQYVGGAQGRHCAVSDLNLDGATDAVIASNNAAMAVTVMLNNGDGTFNLAYYSPALGTWSVAIDDLNFDGYPDIVTTHSASGGRLGVLLNDGLGQFVPAKGSPFASGADSRFVALFDTNSDGLLDAVISNYGINQISVMLGNGDGAFDVAGRSSFPAAAGDPADHPIQMAIGDHNNDLVLDLVYANHGARSAGSVFRQGNGDGTFGDPVPSLTTTRPESMVGPVDFDGDGNLDVVLGTDLVNREVLVKLGDGDGNFSRIVPFLRSGARVRAIGLGDFNNDSYLDVVIANQTLGATLRVYFGDGLGAFLEP